MIFLNGKVSNYFKFSKNGIIVYYKFEKHEDAPYKEWQAYTWDPNVGKWFKCDGITAHAQPMDDNDLCELRKLPNFYNIL